MALARLVALILGTAYLLVGIVAFILLPGGEGDLLGIFPVNVLHNLVHIVLGMALLYGATAVPAAILMSRVVGGVLIVVGLLGIPFPDGFGLLPLGGPDIVLHLVTGAILLAVGFLAPSEEHHATA
jgi:hypothetical protein